MAYSQDFVSRGFLWQITILVKWWRYLFFCAYFHNGSHLYDWENNFLGYGFQTQGALGYVSNLYTRWWVIRDSITDVYSTWLNVIVENITAMNKVNIDCLKRFVFNNVYCFRKKKKWRKTAFETLYYEHLAIIHLSIVNIKSNQIRKINV